MRRELWAFLKRLRLGEIPSGTVAAIESYGVFVALDDGPGHGPAIPSFPGSGSSPTPNCPGGTSSRPRTSSRWAARFLRVLQSDTWNGEARLSLRATQPDPFQAFADGVTVGRALRGRVTKPVPFGVFVEVADGVEGLVRLSEPAGVPVSAPENAVRVGDKVQVVVTEIHRERRRPVLSRRQASPGLRGAERER